MNDLLTVNDTLLDEMFELEAGCEAPHTDPDNLDCSGPVTHRLATLCGVTKLICASTASRNQRLIDAANNRCGHCRIRILEDDWTVTPA